MDRKAFLLSSQGQFRMQPKRIDGVLYVHVSGGENYYYVSNTMVTKTYTRRVIRERR